MNSEMCEVIPARGVGLPCVQIVACGGGIPTRCE